MIGTVLQYIYCMGIRQALLWIALGTCGFLWLEGKLCQRRIWKWFKLGVLMILISVIRYVTLGNRDAAQVAQQIELLFQSYRDIRNGGNIEIYRSNFMNMLLFYPVGLLCMLLLPEKWTAWHRCILTVLVLTAMSMEIEWLQYHYALGRCEVDDVLHNAAGALLGSLAAELLPKLWRFLKDMACSRFKNVTGK